MAARAVATPEEVDSKPIPTQEQIRQRAHELYLQRGCQDGLELEDWLQAEAELRQGLEPDAPNA
jgi:hypothetical protein